MDGSDSDITPSPHILGAAANKRLKRLGDGKLYIVIGDKAIGPVNPDGTLECKVTAEYSTNAQGGTDCQVNLPFLQIVPKALEPGGE